MSSFIALQDLCAKTSPRSVAFEKKTGGLKLFSDQGAINAFLHVSDFHSSFSIHVLSSKGSVIADTVLRFDRNMYPKVNLKNNFCSFGFRLKISSLACKSFFYLVVSWVTKAQTARFLVSSAFVACAKNTISQQSNQHCSYLSLNYFDSEDLIYHENELNVSYYLDKITVFARRELQQNYIVHQPQGLSLSNHRDAVISAVVDMFRWKLLIDFKKELQLFSTFWTDKGDTVIYSQIEMFSQSILDHFSGAEVINTTLCKVIEENHNNGSLIIEDEDQSRVLLQFILSRCKKKNENMM
jgi:hypothetical protein